MITAAGPGQVTTTCPMQRSRAMWVGHRGASPRSGALVAPAFALGGRRATGWRWLTCPPRRPATYPSCVALVGPPQQTPQPHRWGSTQFLTPTSARFFDLGLEGNRKSHRADRSSPRLVAKARGPRFRGPARTVVAINAFKRPPLTTTAAAASPLMAATGPEPGNRGPAGCRFAAFARSRRPVHTLGPT